jgi:Rha family phage regulatory protein
MTEVLPAVQLPPIPMTIREGHPRVTSRDVAEIFGKRHDNVLRDIQRLDCSEPFRLLNFEESAFVNAQNKPQPMVEMTRDGFTFLAMGFTGPRAAQFKEAFIAAFNAMESQLRGGAALPALAQAVDTMQRNVAALIERQAEVDTKVNAILDLVDVTKRYVSLLESNQKKKPRTRPYATVTSEVEDRVRLMFAQGYTKVAIALEIDLPRTTIYRIIEGGYSPARREHNDRMAQVPGGAQ